MRLLSLCVITSTLLACSANSNALSDESPKGPWLLDTPHNSQIRNQHWQPVVALSDEFEEQTVSPIWDTRNIIPGKYHWNGRYPGLFQRKNISVVEGELRLEGKQETVQFEGREWTHTGAIMRSKAQMQLGMYTEAKMKTTTTIMSGTFWMQTPGSQDCKKVPKTELDVTESIGRSSGKFKPAPAGETRPSWYEKARADFLVGMNATARQRKDKCTPVQVNVETPQHAGGSFSPSEDFHVYGFHWKQADQLDFYIDGEFSHTLTPSIPFEHPMSLIMAIETYDFNWPSGDAEKDGFTASKKDRSTRYQWVRTWQPISPE